MTPDQFLTFSTAVTKLVTDTQAVMTLRLMGMAGALPAEPGENARMVAEKGPAFAKAISEMTAAVIAGQRPDQIVSAGIEPLQTEVSNNRDRLSK